MSATEVQWIGSSCGRHGSLTFYKGFRINCRGAEKSYCLGQFYFVRNSEDRPICLAELQLIWHDASTDSKLASARLYFKPENTPFGRLSIHGEDELLYADQKVVIKCEDMLQWEYHGKEWTSGLIPLQESDFLPIENDVCVDLFTGHSEQKYRLKNRSLETKDSSIPAEKILIFTFQAYCRYKALQKRLQDGMVISRSNLSALGGVITASNSTRIVFCRECFSCPDLDKFHLSGENKAPSLKGRPRKKRIRSSTLAKELKRKRFFAELERAHKNLPPKKIKLSEPEEGTESDLSEGSTKSSESMDEFDQPKIRVETPISKTQPPNGLLPVSIKKVAMVTHATDKTKAPPPLIPTTKLKPVVTSPPPLHKVKIKTEVPMETRLDSGPPPLCPISQRSESSIKSLNSPLLGKAKSDASRTHLDPALTLSSKAYTVIKSSGAPNPTSSSGTSSIMASNTDAAPLNNVDSKVVTEGRAIGIAKLEGKENLQDTNKTKKKRLRQPGSMKEFNEDAVDDDEKYFMRSLREFMKSRDTPISKIPALGFKRVNLWTMYKTAQKLGGYDMVTSKRLWRQVYDALGGSTTITSAATYTRRHYERLLLPYERFVRGQLNAKKASQQQQAAKLTQDSTDSKEHSNPPITSSCDTAVSRIPVTNSSSISKESSEDKELSGVSMLSRDSLKSTVVKVKPNGAIPSYSVSIQSAKKDGVTPSSVIVTKSVDVPVSHTPSSAPRNSSTPASNKGSNPVTSQVFQRRSDVTTIVTPHQGNAIPPSSRSVIVSKPMRSPVSTANVTAKKDYLTSSVVMQKQPPQVNGRIVTHPSQSVNHKIGYPVVTDDQTKLQQRKVSESEFSQEKHPHNKYLAVAEICDMMEPSSQSAKNHMKRNIEDDQSLEQSSRPDKESHLKLESISRGISMEPMVKRPKTPSPCHAISQHQYPNHVDSSRNVNHVAVHPGRHGTPTPHVTGIPPHSRPTVCDGRQETMVHGDMGKPDVYDAISHPKIVVDLTTDLEAQSQSSASLVQRRTSSPMYIKVNHLHQQDHVTDACQKSEPRLHSNTRHLPVMDAKDSHVQRDHHDDMTPMYNHNATEGKLAESPYLRDVQPGEFDPHVNAELHRTMSQRTSIESPDAHFQEWRRRQTLGKYPAYVTANPNEPRRRPSLTEQAVPLHPQTPPLEHRYVYVQEDNGLPPRVLEEVPLILSSKQGMYYPEDSFYGALPFYHGGWPAAGVTEGHFKADPEMLRNNNHLRSTSCIFMPTSQMFGSAGPITPISPPINQGHMTSGPEVMHPHCLMTSPYPHNRVIVTQTPTRTLHSYT